MRAYEAKWIRSLMEKSVDSRQNMTDFILIEYYRSIFSNYRKMESKK